MPTYRLPSLDLTLPSGYIQAGLMQASIAPMDKTPPTCSDLIEPMPSVWKTGTRLVHGKTRLCLFRILIFGTWTNEDGS